MPRKQKYPHDEIERRYVDLGQTPADIAEYFAPRAEDEAAYLKALKRIRAVIKKRGLSQVAQGVRAIEPEVKAVVQDKRAQLLKIATGLYERAFTQVAALQARLGKKTDKDGNEVDGEITAAELSEYLDVLNKSMDGLARVGLDLTPPPIQPIDALLGAGILAEAADKAPGSAQERERLLIVYEKLRSYKPSGPPPGVPDDDDDPDE